MKNLLKMALCSSVMMAGSALTANASSITSVQSTDNSTVVVERNGNFETASTSTSLLAGDAVYALNGATANVTLSADCIVALDSNQVLTVASTELQDCASMYSLETFNADHLTKLKSSNIQGESSLVIPLLAAAAAIAGIIVIVDDNDEDFPASP